jgi:hypothetical protein
LIFWKAVSCLARILELEPVPPAIPVAFVHLHAHASKNPPLVALQGHAESGLAFAIPEIPLREQVVVPISAVGYPGRHQLAQVAAGDPIVPVNRICQPEQRGHVIGHRVPGERAVVLRQARITQPAGNQDSSRHPGPLREAGEGGWACWPALPVPFPNQATASLTPPQWTAANVLVPDDGTNYWVTLGHSGPPLFFRLHRL